MDPHWGQEPKVGQPRGVAPQSYLSKARGRDGWRMVQKAEDVGSFESKDRLPRQIQAREYWPSDPTVVRVTYGMQPDAKGQAALLPKIVNVDIVSEVRHCAWWERLGT